MTKHTSKNEVDKLKAKIANGYTHTNRAISSWLDSISWRQVLIEGPKRGNHENFDLESLC